MHPLARSLGKRCPAFFCSGGPRKRAAARSTANRQYGAQVRVVALHAGERVQAAVLGVDVNLCIGILVEEAESSAFLGAGPLAMTLCQLFSHPGLHCKRIKDGRDLVEAETRRRDVLVDAPRRVVDSVDKRRWAFHFHREVRRD